MAFGPMKRSVRQTLWMVNIIPPDGSGTRHPATMAEEKGLTVRVSRTTDRYSDHEDDRRHSHESHISEHETVEVVSDSLGEYKERNGMHMPKLLADEIKVLSHVANGGHRWKRTSPTDGKLCNRP